MGPSLRTMLFPKFPGLPADSFALSSPRLLPLRPHRLPRSRAHASPRTLSSCGTGPRPLSAPLPTFRSASQRGRHTRDLFCPVPVRCQGPTAPAKAHDPSNLPACSSTIRTAKELMPRNNDKSLSLSLAIPPRAA
ncbi:hypothetical protein B0T16DRAFT_421833 [Cercophora newfieldiana]|uniref:Uncharacterized protein n=1 Tax=Cercophora newfieldiana TaxID=92897 RepID=A0AA39XRC2_9PEZI|nr:hypothetical protein B0T16DRAFT_421833 [Cercophora newfieldiana]